jgi:hypothetical protein
MENQFIKVLKIVWCQKGIKPSPSAEADGEKGDPPRRMDGTPGNRIQPGPSPVLLRPESSAFSLSPYAAAYGERVWNILNKLYTIMRTLISSSQVREFKKAISNNRKLEKTLPPDSGVVFANP